MLVNLDQETNAQTAGRSGEHCTLYEINGDLSTGDTMERRCVMS